MSRCFVALGGNTGLVTQTFDQALDHLQKCPGVEVGRTSHVYQTPAVGADAGGEFLNAAAEIETDRLPLDLLDLLLAVETEFGRTHTHHWSPRPLDLDLILYGDDVLDLPRLRVPHAACWYRRFVLDPMCDIAADHVHPERDATFGELRARLLVRPLPVTLAGGDHTSRQSLADALQPEFPLVQFIEPTTSRRTNAPVSVLDIWLGTSPTEDAAVESLEQLPRTSRLDLSTVVAADQAELLRHVLQSALLEPRPYNRPLRKMP